MAQQGFDATQSDMALVAFTMKSYHERGETICHHMATHLGEPFTRILVMNTENCIPVMIYKSAS